MERALRRPPPERGIPLREAMVIRLRSSLLACAGSCLPGAIWRFGRTGYALKTGMDGGSGTLGKGTGPLPFAHRAAAAPDRRQLDCTETRSGRPPVRPF